MLYDPKRISEKGFAVCERDQSRWSSQRSCTQLTGRAPACMTRSIVGPARLDGSAADRVHDGIDLEPFLNCVERREGEAGLCPERCHEQLLATNCLMARKNRIVFLDVFIVVPVDGLDILFNTSANGSMVGLFSPVATFTVERTIGIS